MLNEVQVRSVIEGYSYKINVERVTNEILALAIMQGESQQIEIQVKKILDEWLEEDEVEVCLQKLNKANSVNNSAETIKTIVVEGSESDCYASLMKHRPKTELEKEFKKNLELAINAKVASFIVPVNDPSIDWNYKIHYAPDCYPAVDYPYRQLEKIAEKNGVRLGNKYEYCLFLGTMIIRLIGEGWYKPKAWAAVCNDSNALGNYWDSRKAKHDLELTGSRKIAGKCDLANTCKILAKDESGVVWIAGGDCFCYGSYAPLARFRQLYDISHYYGVGWFVL